MPNTKTVPLLGGETAVKFGENYSHFWVLNLGDSDILMSPSPGIVPGADGVMLIPAGSGRSSGDLGQANTLYFSGSGKVEITPQHNAVCPFFKRAGKGGDGNACDNSTNIICQKFSGLASPVKRADNLSEFFSAFDAAFGSHVSAHCHYIDDIHSFAFSNNGMAVNLYINSFRAYASCQFSDSSPVYYIFGKNKNALYFYSETTANGACYQISVTAAKDSAGVWYVFVNSCTNNAWGTTTFYCDTPNTTAVPYKFALKTATDLPYIISPCHDHGGGVFPELFRVESLTASDGALPVLTAGDGLCFGVLPHPKYDSATAAFAVSIDPADYD